MNFQKIRQATVCAWGFFLVAILAQRKNESMWSNFFGFTMRLYLLLILIYGCWLPFNSSTVRQEISTEYWWAASILTAGGLLTFARIIFLLLFNYGDEISLNPRQLLFDTLVSGLFLIMAFSLLYWAGGLSVSEGRTYSPSALDALYFSAVTFSTLGYGDFAPSQDFRILAALEAIIGNLHLGMIAGSVLAAIRR